MTKPSKPKIIVEIQGRPFVTYLLDHIIAAGFQEVILCTGYMSGLVKSEIGDKYKNLQIRYSEEKKPLGTGGALRQALPLIKTSKIMVMNGDSYVGIDYRILLQEVHRREQPAAICVVKVKDTSRYGRVVLGDNHSVVSFEEKSDDQFPGLINAGIYIFNRELIEPIPLGEFISIEKDCFPEWVDKQLYGYVCDGRFIDIGTPESYHQAIKFFTNSD